MPMCRVVEGELGYEISAVFNTVTGEVKKYRFVIFRCVAEQLDLLEGFGRTFAEAQESARWWLQYADSALQVA